MYGKGRSKFYSTGPVSPFFYSRAFWMMKFCFPEGSWVTRCTIESIWKKTLELDEKEKPGSNRRFHWNKGNKTALSEDFEGNPVREGQSPCGHSQDILQYFVFARNFQSFFIKFHSIYHRPSAVPQSYVHLMWKFKWKKDDPSSVVVVDFVVLPTTGRITRSFEKNLADSQVFHM